MSSSHYGSPSPVPPVNPDVESPPPNVPVSGLGLSGGALPAPTTGPDGPFEDQSGQIFYRNRKRVALRAVLESFATEVVNLGGTSAEPKSVTLTEGLGGTDSIWESPAADEAADSIHGIIASIISRFKSKMRAIEHEWENEPVFVKQDDPRAYQDY